MPIYIFKLYRNIQLNISDLFLADASKTTTSSFLQSAYQLGDSICVPNKQNLQQQFKIHHRKPNV